MKHLKWLGFLVVTFCLMGISNVSAAELTETEIESEEIKLEFDLFSGSDSIEQTFINNNGEEVTLKIERVEEETIETNGEIDTFSTHYMPFGTTKYKISQSSGIARMSFYVDVYIPSNINNSKFTKVYENEYEWWYLGGNMYDHNLSISSGGKESTYRANVSLLGGLGGGSCWVKGVLSGNVLTMSAKM